MLCFYCAGSFTLWFHAVIYDFIVLTGSSSAAGSRCEETLHLHRPFIVLPPSKARAGVSKTRAFLCSGLGRAAASGRECHGERDRHRQILRAVTPLPETSKVSQHRKALFSLCPSSCVHGVMMLRLSRYFK